MKGARKDGIDPAFFEPGDYGKWSDRWWISTPSGFLERGVWREC